MRTVAHLYLHVPFCRSKCRYCAFYSRPAGSAQMAAYAEAVLGELRSVTAKLAQRGYRLAPETIYFGGGTPSLLPVRLMRRLLTAVGKLRPPQAACEWTIECNPATVTLTKAKLYRDHGINRISLGVQSFDDRLLNRLGRLHTAAQAHATYQLLRRSGFTNINLDLMFAIPGQTLAHWQATLQQAIALRPEHISAYCLTREEGTDFAMLPVDEELERDMFELTIATLSSAGYRHYEISNFALPGFECRHNIAYWRGENFLGLGPSAVSTVGAHRWQNIADINRYVSAVQQSHSPVSFQEHLTAAVRAAERAAFGLRMSEGIPARWARSRWPAQIERLIRDGLLHQEGARLRLTARGLLFADEVATAFV